jgi:hypothetical protein
VVVVVVMRRALDCTVDSPVVAALRVCVCVCDVWLVVDEEGGDVEKGGRSRMSR